MDGDKFNVTSRSHQKCCPREACGGGKRQGTHRCLGEHSGGAGSLGRSRTLACLSKKINCTKSFSSLAVLRLLVSRQLPGSKEQARSTVISLSCCSSCLRQSRETALVSSPQRLIHQPPVVNSFIGPRGFSPAQPHLDGSKQSAAPHHLLQLCLLQPNLFCIDTRKKLHKVVQKQAPPVISSYSEAV